MASIGRDRGADVDVDVETLGSRGSGGRDEHQLGRILEMVCCS